VRSIGEFGFTNPLLVDETGGLIAGHGRWAAARVAGLAEVPCIELAGLSDTQRRALVLADNKLALNAGWDDSLLALELADLCGLGVDMQLAGFSADELGLGAVREPDAGIDYEEKFAIIISCADEPGQRAVFDQLTGMGFACKVLVN
jgi:ParB-like chromosome segregation protein Spo0J